MERGAPRIGRRRALGWIAGAGLVPASIPRLVRADEPDVPVGTQMDLVAKVVKYDRNADARMGGTCRALVLRRDGDGGSRRVAAQVSTALAELGEIAGAEVQVTEHAYEDAAKLAELCAARSIGLMFVTPGFSDEVVAISRALVDMDLITIAMLPRDVPPGIVLGFALESSRPSILVNLTQARRQNVDFSARLLALAKVVG